MTSVEENILTKRVGGSDKKVVSLRVEVGKAEGDNAKEEHKHDEDVSRMQKFYEYCERIIAAQYAMWKKNGTLKY